MNAFIKLTRLPLLCFAALALSSFSNNPALSQEATAVDFEVLQQLPHAQNNFTQGLFFHEGSLYESVGQYGQSKLIRYDRDFHTPLMARSLAAKYFAEGATALNGTIYQLTWRAETALAYEPRRLSRQEGFTYEGEGWGLASDGTSLWMSNGSDTITRLDSNGQVISSLDISFNGNPLDRLNELEWVEGKLFANRWYDNRIYIIDPQSGQVTSYLNLENLAAPELNRGRENVLNGIAWNPATKRLWITGKNWHNLYEIGLSDQYD